MKSYLFNNKRHTYLESLNWVYLIKPIYFIHGVIHGLLFSYTRDKDIIDDPFNYMSHEQLERVIATSKQIDSNYDDEIDIEENPKYMTFEILPNVYILYYSGIINYIYGLAARYLPFFKHNKSDPLYKDTRKHTYSFDEAVKDLRERIEKESSQTLALHENDDIYQDLYSMQSNFGTNYVVENMPWNPCAIAYVNAIMACNYRFPTYSEYKKQYEKLKQRGFAFIPYNGEYGGTW